MCQRGSKLSFKSLSLDLSYNIPIPRTIRKDLRRETLLASLWVGVSSPCSGLILARKLKPITR
ncbi:MAG: hypothetical protein A3G93_09850 [Nitrospinae bacterium RIFCSPLOWO2_12_FULL_45_22]|nr:MAG: hypothetical protein A3G93_09850 [Nitrospinae bacterium RIFCSPLOWO2_12_FULL_45_22]